MAKLPSTFLLNQLRGPTIRVLLSEKRNEDTHIHIAGRRFQIVGSTKANHKGTRVVWVNSDHAFT